jgi:hypothetical protein
MTDDLKERLRAGVPITKQILLEGVTFDLRGFLDLQQEALARITDLEARLAAAKAGEDALAADLRRFRHTAALAAYEARRKG